MPTPIRAAAIAALAVLFLPSGARAISSATDLASQAIRECEEGRDATARDVRKEHFTRGESLATRAVEADDRNAQAHFAVVCNLGESLRLDGEKLTSVFALRRLMAELDRTLELDPGHLQAMATKGNLLMRLPRMLGGNPKEGERLLSEVVRRDDLAFTSRIVLARTYNERGQRDEAVQLATRAMQIAREQGRAEKLAEAQATLDQLGAAR